MPAGAITGYFDVAQITLYAFWIFFIGLVIYLRREDKREGYPLVPDVPGRRGTEGFPPLPKPKTYLMSDGSTRVLPGPAAEEPRFRAEPLAAWPGAPLQPIGDAMTANFGPAAYALRADGPDLAQEGGQPRVVPLRVATDHSIDPESIDPRGMDVIGADGLKAGTVSDIWIDAAETVARYLEVALPEGGSVLAPLPMARIDIRPPRVMVGALKADQFAGVPRLASPDIVTLREEDRISAYYAGGMLFADRRRTEPLL